MGLWLALGGDNEDEAAVPEPPRLPIAEPIVGLVAELSEEEMVDQVLLLGFDGAALETPFLEQLRGRQLGGVLVGTQNWPDATTGTALVEQIRRAARGGDRFPPLVVTTQEGGPYRALADLPPEQTQLEIGETGSAAAAEQWAAESCEALARAGFDLNLAPVADVATLDSAVGDRAFSDDPAVVAELTAAAVRGCRRAGIASAPLHFPGLGGASQDTSRGPATVSLDVPGLQARDLPPFRAAFSEGAPGVVLSLAFYAAYDPVTPGALAPAVASGLLRDQFGYGGVAITDDLGSGAVRAGDAVPKAAVRALAAGADLLQIGDVSDQAGVREEILQALEDGDLSTARLAEAAGRVLELKSDLGLLDFN